jgi:hypothetical protein
VSAKIVKLPEHRTWQRWAAAINASWQKGVESVVETGRLLIEAKECIDHGEFAAMVQLRLSFNPSTAQRLMRIAEHPILSNAAHGPHLPPSWRTLYELAKVPDPILQTAIADGTVNPKMERKDVAVINPNKSKREKRRDDVTKHIEALARALENKTRQEKAEAINTLRDRIDIGIQDLVAVLKDKIVIDLKPETK